MYDHSKQYRCTIIRGKSQKEMDDLLPAYAKVIDEICPCNAEDFETLFNNSFKYYLPVSARIKKTLDNHRTEISGKLFGMYFIADDGIVYESERTQKYLNDSDQPAFFKDICYKMQFPNGTQKIQTIKARINDNIKLKPNAFIIKLLQIAETAKIDITKKDIGYYILNSLDVLQGNANPYEVLEAISNDKKNGIERIITVPGKASSYCYQHINEQINYLELANLIRVTDDKRVFLNHNEDEAIDIFSASLDSEFEFDVNSYSLETIHERKEFQLDWDFYFSRLSNQCEHFATSATSLVSDFIPQDTNADNKKSKANLTEFGDEGEELVFKYEKERVSAFNERLSNKVLWLGKTRGLGYDIQSVIAEPGEMSEFVKYIEVKSTKRLTCPDLSDTLWIDTLNITRNEYMAALQHKEYYSIFRVYFTRDGIFVFVLNNINQKLSDKKITAVPMVYRVEFTHDSVDTTFQIQRI